MTEKKVALGYIRVSTEEQVRDGYSLKNQEEVIKRKCEYEEWDLKEIFHDKGISGASMNEREGIKNLLNYVKSHKVDYVIVYKISRLSRKIADVVAIADLLEKAGVAFIALKDNIDTSTQMGKYFLIFGAIFAEMERESIITQVKGGMEQKAREGEWNGGMPPLGYNLINKQLKIHDGEASVVKLIFSEYLKGKGYTAIADLLNEKGHKTKKGNLFGINAVKEILKNPVYCGHIRWAYRKDWGKRNEENKRKRQYNKEPINAQGKHAAIIDEGTYERVQHMIDTNPRNHMKQFNGHHLLSGLLRCPDCDSKMSMQIVNSKGKQYHYYSCNQYQNKKGCKANMIAKSNIEGEFLGVFEKAINEPSILNTMLAGLNNVSQVAKELDNDIKRKEKEVEKLQGKESQLTDELLMGNENYKATIRRKIQEVSDEIVKLESDINRLRKTKHKNNESQLNSKEIIEVFKNVGKAIPTFDKPVQQSLVRTLVTSIRVENKRIAEIQFSFQKRLKVDYSEGSGESAGDDMGFGVERGTVNRTTNRCGFGFC